MKFKYLASLTRCRGKLFYIQTRTCDGKYFYLPKSPIHKLKLKFDFPIAILLSMYYVYSFSGLTVATEGLQEAHFAMARKDAVYFYSTDGRGQCYAIEGEKCNIFWFRNYLVIVTKETPMWARNSADIHKGIIDK